jgi:HAMP domain-containing protein
VTAPDGGRYLFAWEFGRQTRSAHDRLLLLLLALMLAVFFTAHVVLSRALRPLRALHDGVQRLSAGDLDVIVENRTATSSASSPRPSTAWPPASRTW